MKLPIEEHLKSGGKLPVTIKMLRDPKLVERSLVAARRKIGCGFCSMRGTVICDFPGCGRPLCAKHATSTGTAHMCPDHNSFAELNPPEASKTQSD